ncbi:ABC-F family ATP-binding cassette domain-containing protein [Pseudomonas taiwanensis]|uniref:ABC-F family ATP-binding cassette domain-containing protein n=1 Tax=Pseudomonas taiwanensis TaxID=470150 RepID=UPI0016444D6E|nr:ATP-binding cassette domain-containing protein [Pseudomonas taiwanensis]MBC3492466.1 ATP-binding cassette domain-containing protein [Pseudomonas taiwanensis]
MLKLNNIELRLGTKILLQQASLTINTGEKVSLVGRNGVGKSSLFSLVTGRLHEDIGDFEMPAGWRISEVSQQMPETSESATSFVVQGDERLVAARKLLADATEAEDGMAMAQAYSDLADAGHHDAESRAQVVLVGLGFPGSELNKPVNTFSGGWRMRLLLARALMCPCDLMLLDEPTNHLDLDALTWLEAWLRKFDGTLIVISHDREFLDSVTSVTVHMHDTILDRYNTTYSGFEVLRAERIREQEAAYSRQQEKIDHLYKYIDRFRYKATKARQAQSRLKALDRMKEITAVASEADFNFTFRDPANLPSPMVVLESTDLGYSNAQTSEQVIILSKISQTILAGQRIGILGANGKGKSTLIKTLAEQLPAVAGTVTRGKGLVVGYFAQHELEILNADETPLSQMFALASCQNPVKEQEIRNYLGTFNISGAMLTERIGRLSGGEKARLVLAMIVWQKPNLLLLDEPTNHLDIATREALALALNQFDGTVILVSHDRALLRLVCDEFWLVNEGRVEPFEGDLEDYRQFLVDLSKRAASSKNERFQGTSPQPSQIPSAKSGAVKRRQDVIRELEKLEQRITETTAAKHKIETQLASSVDPDAAHELCVEYEALDLELENLETAWITLQDA